MSTQAQDRPRTHWLEFSATIMFAVGFFRIITAIAHFANSSKIDDLSRGLFSNNLWAWGLWDLLIAAVAIFGGLSLLRGKNFGKLVGYVWGVLLLLQSFVIIGVAPWLAAGLITLAVLVMYGLGTIEVSSEMRS
jgi:hypothetical protein